MYHFEIRKFPHLACRFNQSEGQLGAVLAPWVNEDWIEMGERKWNVNEATLTVLEGPKLAMSDLAMGRGWRNAQRRGEDVTERVLAEFKQAAAAAAAGADGKAGGQQAAGEGGAASADLELLADSLGLELLGLLDEGAAPLSRAWGLAQERLGERPAAESLALGEQAVRSLLRRGLVVLQSDAMVGVDAPGGADVGGLAIDADQIETLMRAPASWAGDAAGSLAIARKS